MPAINIYLPDSVVERIRELMEKEGKTISQVIQELLLKSLER